MAAISRYQRARHRRRRRMGNAADVTPAGSGAHNSVSGGSEGGIRSRWAWRGSGTSAKGLYVIDALRSFRSCRRALRRNDPRKHRRLRDVGRGRVTHASGSIPDALVSRVEWSTAVASCPPGVGLAVPVPRPPGTRPRGRGAQRRAPAPSRQSPVGWRRAARRLWTG